MRTSNARRSLGLSYVEAMIGLAILATALVPAARSIIEGARSGVEATAVSTPWLAARAKLEEVLSRPFQELDGAASAAGGAGNPSSYSEAPGTESRRIVYLSRYDGDDADGDGNAFTGVDAGLLWVKVEVEGTTIALTTLTAQ